MTDRDKAMQECEKFHLWLRDKVQNVHYANNEKMAEAYARVYKNIMLHTN
jgi:hypothetical protein